MSQGQERMCRLHPSVPARVICNKHEYGCCEECLDSCKACSDLKLYCRHRQQGIIRELCRKRVKRCDTRPES